MLVNKPTKQQLENSVTRLEKEYDEAREAARKAQDIAFGLRLALGVAKQKLRKRDYQVE